MSAPAQLLLGCGHSRTRKIRPEGWPEGWRNLITLDLAPNVGADIIHDLRTAALPLPDGSCDEIHAYDVLEHIGAQGDWRLLLDQFAEYWRVLQPGGIFCARVPLWDRPWAWGDPGHSRVIQLETLTFLDQAQYAAELDGERPTNRTDYRAFYRADFALAGHGQDEVALHFVLRAVKPSRWRLPGAAAGEPGA